MQNKMFKISEGYSQRDAERYLEDYGFFKQPGTEIYKRGKERAFINRIFDNVHSPDWERKTGVVTNKIWVGWHVGIEA